MGRRTTCLLPALVLAVLLPALLPPPAQAAAPVLSAARDVATVRAQVERAADELSAGAERLERSRSALQDVRRRRDAAEGRAVRAQTRAEAAQDRLHQVVAAGYRSPVPDAVVLALSGPDAFAAAVSSRADLRRASSTSGDVLRDARAQRALAEAATRAAERLEQEAAAQARAVERQVRSLRRAATDAERRLRTATARLTTARRTASQAACGGAAAGSANGFLPRATLCPLAGAPGQALRADAAADFARMTAASLAERGTALCVTDSYRSYARQVDVFARKPSLAAVPGTSRHGWGTALDLGCGVERFGTPAYQWMKANGPRFGWVHPAWAEPGGSMPEPWHWEHVG